MKVLTIRQPWAQLIANGVKDVENRTWRTGVRGRIAIHASAAETSKGDILAACRVLRQCGMRDEASWIAWTMFPRAAIIATAELVDCVVTSDSPWFTGPYGFELRNVKKLATPIPAKGKLGFWEFDVEGWKGESDGN